MKTFITIMKWVGALFAASGLHTLGSYLMNQQSYLWFYIGLSLNVSIVVGLLVLVWESFLKEETSNINNQKQKQNEN